VDGASRISMFNQSLTIWRWWAMADGYPGLSGWGAKSSAAVLARFVHLESIPRDCRECRVNAANASALAGTLCRERDPHCFFEHSPRSGRTSRKDAIQIRRVEFDGKHAHVAEQLGAVTLTPEIDSGTMFLARIAEITGPPERGHNVGVTLATHRRPTTGATPLGCLLSDLET
jgi:hypothetical protein